MKELENNLPYNKYYRVILPSEITIEREDIFYRDKYNEISNYVKRILTDRENSAIQQYFKPKGLLLINIECGTDILNFLKLISKNYYLDFVEFNYRDVSKDPEQFFNNFNVILKEIVKDLAIKGRNKDSHDDFNEMNKPDKLLIINQSNLEELLFNERNLFKLFINIQKNYQDSYLDKGIVIIWINKNINEIEQNSKDVFQTFDLFIKIPLLSHTEREVVLKNFSEKNRKIVFDISQILNLTQNWEVQDIKNLLKTAIFKHFLNSELNDTSNEITDVIINIIESGEFIPSISSKEIQNLKQKEKFKVQDDSNMQEFQRSIMEQIQNQPISEFMVNQFYENAASNNYTELVIVIDKLNKKEILEDNDRKLLAKYAFILNDTPSRAQINLEKAKKRIDHIKQVFKE